MLLGEPIRDLQDVDDYDARAEELSNHQVIQEQSFRVRILMLTIINEKTCDDPGGAEGDLKENGDPLGL